MTTLIKNGTIVTAGDTFQADLLIDGEQISMIGKSLPQEGHDEVIDAAGLLLLPGGIDMYYAAAEGRGDEANALQRTGRALTDLFTSGGRSLYPATKAAMEMLGYTAGDPRPPLQPLAGNALDELRAGLEALKIMT